LKKPLKELREVGTYEGLATASMGTPVIDVIHMLMKKNISSVPILDRDGAVINVFEAVDVIALIKGGVYDDLNLTVGEALLKRSDVSLSSQALPLWANQYGRISLAFTLALSGTDWTPSSTLYGSLAYTDSS